jgi:hypothetical protein
MKIKKIINIIKCITGKFRRDESGLTLFEAVVGIAVSSIILIMIYSSHSSIAKAVHQLTGVADFYENVNLVLRRIDKDISCIYFNKDNKKINFVGKSNYDPPFMGKVNFISIDHQELSMLIDPKHSYPKSDIREVGYFLKQDNKFPDLSFLVRREEAHYDDDIENGGEKNIILENVVDIKFEFRKGNDWTNNWDSRENQVFPKFIKTILKVRNYNKEDEEFVLISKIGIDK